MGRPDDEDVFQLGMEDDDDWDDEDDYAPGPDARDRDLMDGSWEERYYSGRVRRFDWGSVLVALGLIALVALVLPGILVFLR
jgi:hypothetical protein